jgi:hypothetical protein
VVQLYPQALGSLFVASYHSQGYGGGIRTCLHTRLGRISCIQGFIKSVNGEIIILSYTYLIKELG